MRWFTYQINIILLGFLCAQIAFANIDDAASGKQIMQEVYSRHEQFPYVYEEQSIILQDKTGKRDTRRAKRYSRAEEDGTVKFLLLFEHPEEVRGVAVLAKRDEAGNIIKQLYLPAYGEQLFESLGGANEDNFLGTDFSVENLTGENLSDYFYERQQDKLIKGKLHYVVNVFKKEGLHPSPLRRHFIQRDNLFITLTYHFDKAGRISRIQSQHDLKPVYGDKWRANMILMEDKKEQHQSLIKISHRVFSKDYVPAEVFKPEWLFETYPHIEPKVTEEEQVINLFGEVISE